MGKIELNAVPPALQGPTLLSIYVEASRLLIQKYYDESAKVNRYKQCCQGVKRAESRIWNLEDQSRFVYGFLDRPGRSEIDWITCSD
jgi:hypothetical protein